MNSSARTNTSAVNSTVGYNMNPTTTFNYGHLTLGSSGGRNGDMQSLLPMDVSPPPPVVVEGATTTQEAATATQVGTKRQRLQKQRHYATGTILPNYNSIIPCAATTTTAGVGIKSITSEDVLEHISRRVRDECDYLCLLPTEDFVQQREQQQQEEGVGGGDSDGTRRRRWKSSKNQWLRCTVTLVYSLLNLESPNPVGWEDDDITTTTSTVGNGIGATPTTTTTQSGVQTPKSAHWFKGIYHKLCGPQPWQCTRPFIIKAVYQLLLAEGYTDWLLSDQRWGEFEKVIRPMVAFNLIAWKPDVFVEGSDVVEKYSKLIWERFMVDRLRTVTDCEEALVPPQIGFSYVCNVASSEDWSILGKKDEEEKSSSVMEGGEEPSPSTSVEASSDPVPTCLPIGEGNSSDGLGFMWESKWNCDYCSASFSVYDEAVAHENECKMKSQAGNAANDDESVPKESVVTVQNDAGDLGVSVETNVKYAIEETWECDHCSASFSVYNEAVAHENECKAKAQAAEAADMKDSIMKESADTDQQQENGDAVAEINVESATEEKWKCDHCSASFSAYDEAVAHENECKVNAQAAEAANKEDSITKKSPDTGKEKDIGDAVAEINVESATEEKWKCDHCSASFSAYDEAVAHENECKAKSQAVEIAVEENEIKVNTGTSDENVEVQASEWKCDYCSATFFVYDEAVAHENECKTKSEGGEAKKVEEAADMNETDVEANHSSVEGREGFIVQEQWKCDYCSAQFSVFDDAVSHENECNAKMHSAAAVDASTDDEHQTSDEFAEQKMAYKVEEEWQCEYCKERFIVFDEAAAHEAECKRMSEANGSVSNRDADAATHQAGFLDSLDGEDFSPSNELRSSMLKTLGILHYEYFPLMSSGDENLSEVCDEVLRCIHAVTPITKEHDVTSKWRVERVLNHLEHRSGYLSTLNGIFRVRVSTTALVDNSNRESPAEAVGIMQSESEDPEAVVVTYGMNSEGDQVIMAASSPERAAKEVVTKSRTRCGECILCNAPACERCFACVSKGRTKTDLCIRKSCCKLPFEDKAKPLVGFPPNWQYAFCDPNKGVLVKTPRRILSLAGLVIRRPLPAAFQTPPSYQYFHSFEAAFAAVQHQDTSKATISVEYFLSHVHGSDAMKSYPTHFLVGRRFCFEFSNGNGVNVAMYGVISACFRESSEAETDIFMIQYDLDCIEIASKSLGTNVPRLQLLSSEQAWGGCISFERKACPRGRQSVIRSIDQATAVEYWVTPDMRMEEMVVQDNGIQVPMLTIILRGYKFTFSAHHDDEGIAVSVTCVSMNIDDRENDYESILKPGELIDLGVFCPLIDSDTKPLPAFILKNYIHNFSIDSYAGDGNGNVYDLTDDTKGTMNPVAIKKVLSYVRSSDEAEVPTVHGGLDPSGKVHLLFGVRYRGDWEEYTSIMDAEIQPIFRGEQKEVTLARNVTTNEQQEARYMSALKNFGPEDLVQCANFFRCLILLPPTVVPSSGMKKRLRKVATCLRQRISELGDPSLGVVDDLIQRAIAMSR